MPVRNGRSTKINSVRGAGRVQLPWEFKRRRVLTLPQPQQSRWISTTAKPRVQRCTGLAGHSESSVRGRPTDFELAGGCLFLHVSYKRVYVCGGGRTWERLPGVVVTLVGEFFEIAGNGVGNGLKGCVGVHHLLWPLHSLVFHLHGRRPPLGPPRSWPCSKHVKSSKFSLSSHGWGPSSRL
jgi:hypothetical protein